MYDMAQAVTNLIEQGAPASPGLACLRGHEWACMTGRAAERMREMPLAPKPDPLASIQTQGRA